MVLLLPQQDLSAVIVRTVPGVVSPSVRPPGRIRCWRRQERLSVLTLWCLLLLLWLAAPRSYGALFSRLSLSSVWIKRVVGGERLGFSRPVPSLPCVFSTSVWQWRFLLLLTKATTSSFVPSWIRTHFTVVLDVEKQGGSVPCLACKWSVSFTAVASSTYLD
jgi:hypothetical protein